jgi:hypothetical protein
MTDEFDDLDVAMKKPERPAHHRRLRRRTAPARLVSRLYRAAGPEVRARLLGCLLRPLGPLGIAAVAAGAFGSFLYRGSIETASFTLAELTRYSSEQIFELARFVEQTSPDALVDLARMLVEQPMGIAGFSASVVVLLVRTVDRR